MTRSADWCMVGFCTVGVCLTSWYVKVNLGHVVREHLLPTSRQVASPIVPVAMLWLCAESITTALRERVSTAVIFAIVLPLALCLVHWI